MRLRQIEVFHAVLQTGSVSRAAELLHVSQPSVSKVLKHAESSLGFSLFERKGGRLTATREALALGEFASAVQDKVDLLNQSIEQIVSPRQHRVRVAVTPGIGLKVGPEAVADFYASFPGVGVSLDTRQTPEMFGMLIDGQIDLAVAYEPNPHPAIEQLKLSTSEFVCVVGEEHALASKRRLRPEHLDADSLIRLNSEAPLGKLLNSYLDKNGIPGRVAHLSANTYYCAIDLALKTGQVAVVDSISAKSVTGTSARVIKFSEPMRFSITAMHLKSVARSHYLRALIDTFAESLGDLG